ncbi:collagen alpha-6(VI) chain-like [Carcharodon carcharias]|uniref:collagen alpha-6(VI) chain-like n=1 Tax=Carcharodon carcharias TaxID=13397 RepID=UPI001B7E1D46|nr:collagen alpha-6(VI) chain-like [Carcharodon carcharias]
MGRAGFQHVRKLILEIVDKLNVEAKSYRIGLAQFSGDARTEFLLNKFQTKAEVMNYLQSKYAFKGGAALRTGRAMNFLHKEFFTRSAGSRKDDGVPQFAIIITAARSQDDVRTAAKALKSDNVQVISVGIGTGARADLITMAFLPTSQFVVQVNDFNELLQSAKALSTTIKAITQKTSVVEEIKAPPVCQTASLADIAFLVDGSDKIGATNFQLIKEFLTNFIKVLGIGSEQVRVGMVQYSTLPRAEFYFTRFQNKKDVLEHIANLPYRGGKTNTGAAINFLKNNYFELRARGRNTNGIPQIAIVITDGNSDDDVKRPAAALRRLGVTVYALGTENTNFRELASIASYPPETHVSVKGSFAELSEITPKTNIPKKICIEVVHDIDLRPGKIDQIVQGCTETDEADIYFLVDGSGNKQPDDFRDMKNFMIDIVNVFRIGKDKVRIGFVQYGSTIRKEFDIAKYTTENEIKAAIEKINLIKGSVSKAAQALRYMKDLFNEADKSRIYRVRRFLITITDEKAQDDVSMPAAELRQRGIEIYAVGVGKAEQTQLQQIAGTPERAFHTENFDALKEVKYRVIQDMCTKEGSSVEAKPRLFFTALAAIFCLVCVNTVYSGVNNIANPPKVFEQTCSKLEVADMIFVVDGSSSIFPSDFEKVKKFIEILVNKTEVGKTRVQYGVIKFSTYVTLEFQLDQYDDKAELLNAVNRIQQIGGDTNIGAALKFTIDYFNSSKGGRPGERQYLIVITDGAASDHFPEAAKAIRDKNINILAIGIINANNDELTEIAGSIDNVYHVDSFDALKDLEKMISFEVCSPIDECKRIEVADIVFVLDGSDGINTAQFNSMKDFMMAMVNRSEVDRDNVRFGAIVYGNNAQTIFQLDHFTSKAEIRDAVLGLRKETRGSRNTVKALEHANKLLTAEHGGRPQSKSNVPQMVIFITNGPVTDSSDIPSIANTFKTNNVEVYAIGVKGANKQQLMAITGSEAAYYAAEDFNYLNTLSKIISSWLCKETRPECKLKKADIVFLMDGSKIVTSNEFQLMKEGLIDFVKLFNVGPDHFQFALVQYGATQRYEFNLTQSGSQDMLRKNIDRITKLGGGAATGAALKFVNGLFQQLEGSRRNEQVPQYLLVITSGSSVDNVVPAAAELRKQDIEIFALGIKHIKSRELLQITGSAMRKLFIKDIKDLSKVKRRIVRGICTPSVPKDDPVCTIDIAVGFDFSRRTGSENIFASQQKLQAKLHPILQKIVSIQNISCISAAQLNIRVGYHVRSSTGQSIFETEFEGYNPEILDKLLAIQSNAKINLNADNLKSFLGVFSASKASSKVILLFTDGLDDTETRLKQSSKELSDKGVQRLITVALEDAVNVDEILHIEFGSGLGYKQQLTIEMDDIGQALLQQINAALETKCCKVVCTCFGEPGVIGLQGSKGLKGQSGVKGFQGYPGEEGGAGERGPPGYNGTLGDDGCPGPRGFTGRRGYRGQKGNDGDFGINGIIGEQGAYGISGPSGENGISGKPGTKGRKGFSGDRGETGSRGDPGEPGTSNIVQGPKGDTGNPGQVGDTGRSGNPGKRGDIGNLGADGERGQLGPQGAKGRDGVEGPQGDPGIRGQQGTSGVSGTPGRKGEQGARGRQGPSGESGPLGINGELGHKGKTGQPGNPGEKGVRGIEGPRGITGTDGKNRFGPKGIKGKKELDKHSEEQVSRFVMVLCKLHHVIIEGTALVTSYSFRFLVEAVCSAMETETSTIGYCIMIGSRSVLTELVTTSMLEKMGSKLYTKLFAKLVPASSMLNIMIAGSQCIKCFIAHVVLVALLPDESTCANLATIPSSKLQAVSLSELVAAHAKSSDGVSLSSLSLDVPPDQVILHFLGIRKENGKRGGRGTPGNAGPQGKDGEPGFPGNEGLKGIRGRRGTSGHLGDPGDAGMNGYPGERGQKGPPGSALETSCGLVAYIRRSCPCCSQRSGGCPAYPTELVFALDSSADVTPPIFERMKRIVISFVEDINIAESNCPTGARVAILTYTNAAKPFIRFSAFKKKHLLLKEIERLTQEQSTNKRNIGVSMQFVARNTFKRIRNGVLVKKVAVFITNGESQDTEAIVAAATQFSALGITPVIISFKNIPEVKRAFQNAVVVLPRQQPRSQELLRQIYLCSLCYDECSPEDLCPKPITLLPIPVNLDLAFIVDDLEQMETAKSETVQHFLNSMLNQFISSTEPKASDLQPRVALVQHTSNSAPGYGKGPFNLEFGVLDYTAKTLKKRHIQDSFFQLEDFSGIGSTIEWSLKNFFPSLTNQHIYKVIFTIFSGRTIIDEKRLLEISREAKCKGFAMFALALGEVTNVTVLEEFVSFPFDQHLVQLDRVLEPEMEYAQKFSVAFLKNLATGINNYPPPSLKRECVGINSHNTTEPETFPDVPMNIMQDFEEQKDDTNIYDECALNLNEGDCSNYSLKWFFDKTLQVCKRFWYGGCGGNKNRFDTRSECEALCLRSAF